MQIVVLAVILSGAICYGLFRYALTLHSVPGSWMLGVSLLFAIATIFELGLGCGLLLSQP